MHGIELESIALLKHCIVHCIVKRNEYLSPQPNPNDTYEQLEEKIPAFSEDSVHFVQLDFAGLQLWK